LQGLDICYAVLPCDAEGSAARTQWRHLIRNALRPIHVCPAKGAGPTGPQSRAEMQIAQPSRPRP